MKAATDRSRPAPQDEHTAAALKLWVVLSRAHRSIGERARRDMEQYGLSPTEFAVLEVLFHKGPLPLGEIGSRVLLTSGSTTYVIDKLEQRQLLTRRACAEDRRVVFAELTVQGRALMDRVFPQHAEALCSAMRALSPEEQRVAAAMLKRLGRGAAAEE